MNPDELESEFWDAIEGGEFWGDERDELAEQLDEVIAAQARLYTFEDEVFGDKRHAELLQEVTTLE